MAYRNYAPSNGFIVATDGNGDFTDLGPALTAATSGQTIFVRTGTYTNNYTLKAGVNITAFDCDSTTPNVIINGTCTLSASGTVSISGIQLKTNSAPALTVSGSAASIVNLNNCYINCLNNTGISFSSSNSSAQINIFYCQGNLATTGIGLFSSSSAGTITAFASSFTNTGSSTTATTLSAGAFYPKHCYFFFPISTTSTGGTNLFNTFIDCAALNTIPLTINGTTTSNCFCLGLNSGTASAISIGTGATFVATYLHFSGGNANMVTGAGTFDYTCLDQGVAPGAINAGTNTGFNFYTGPLIAPSINFGQQTLSNYSEGTWTPTMTGSSTTGTTTYTTQQGYYRRIGNMVTIQGVVVGTGATGTGGVVIGGFPFTIKNQANSSPVGSIISAASYTFPVSTTSIALFGQSNTTQATIWCSGTVTAGTNMAIANVAFNFQFTMTYEI